MAVVVWRIDEMEEERGMGRFRVGSPSADMERRRTLAAEEERPLWVHSHMMSAVRGAAQNKRQQY